MLDVPTDSTAVQDRVMLYPHELCPIDGMVVNGIGSMDESLLTGETFLIAKAPGTTVLSGAIDGDVALTIEATCGPARKVGFLFSQGNADAAIRLPYHGSFVGCLFSKLP